MDATHTEDAMAGKIETFVYPYSATLRTGNSGNRYVEIHDSDGEWVGTGQWVDGMIQDCWANLGRNPEETEEIYQALEKCLRDEEEAAK